MCLRIRDRMILIATGVLVALLAFAPRASSVVRVSGQSISDHVLANPDDLPVKTYWEFGWKNSPLVVSRYELTLTEVNGKILKRETLDTKIHWASLSALTLVVGLACILAGMFVRSKPRNRAP